MIVPSAMSSSMRFERPILRAIASSTSPRVTTSRPIPAPVARLVHQFRDAGEPCGELALASRDARAVLHARATAPASKWAQVIPAHAIGDASPRRKPAYSRTRSSLHHTSTLRLAITRAGWKRRPAAPGRDGMAPWAGTALVAAAEIETSALLSAQSGSPTCPPQRPARERKQGLAPLTWRPAGTVGRRHQRRDADTLAIASRHERHRA
jgi:hypothetical protein